VNSDFIVFIVLSSYTISVIFYQNKKGITKVYKIFLLGCLELP